MLQLLIPALIVVVGLFLYFKRPTTYIAYTLWVWFLTPFIRRLVDWQLGWNNQSLILLTPFLVTSLSLMTLIRPSRREISLLPTALLICIAGAVYGFLIGMYYRPTPDGVYGLFAWVAPLLFGIHVTLDWRNYEANRKVVLDTFTWAAGVMGIYGIYQFIFAPEWDRFWLININAGLIDPSFGQPEPYLIRVWSTLNAPGPFAGAMGTCLIFLAISASRFKVPFGVVGYVSFLLSSVRAAWLGWVLGIFLLLRKAKPALLARVGGLLLVLAACVVPIVQNPQLAPFLGERLTSITDVHGDESLHERQAMYRTITGMIIHEPFGRGLGSSAVIGNLVVDSGILIMLLSLGWLGTILFLGGTTIFMIQSANKDSKDPFIFACRAVLISTLCQLPSAMIFGALGGTIFWMCAGLCMGEIYWVAEQKPDPLSDALPVEELTAVTA